MEIKRPLLFSVFLLLSLAGSVHGQVIQTKDYYEVINDYLIVAASKDYKEARKIAIDCSEKLQISFHERGAVFDTVKRELVYPKDTLGILGDNNGNIIRGLRYINPYEADNGVYITIEQTDNYSWNLKPGLYIVVLGSANRGDGTLKTLLVKAKKIYPDSYIKTTILFKDACGQ